jgi:hypothetical protein
MSLQVFTVQRSKRTFYRGSSSTWPGFEPHCSTISQTYAKSLSTAKGLRGSVFTKRAVSPSSVETTKSSQEVKNQPRGKLCIEKYSQQNIQKSLKDFSGKASLYGRHKAPLAMTRS